MSKGDRVMARTGDGAVYTLIATKVGGEVGFEVSDDDEDGSALLVMREMTRSGVVLRRIELDYAQVQGVVRDRYGDGTLGLMALDGNGAKGKKR